MNIMMSYNNDILKRIINEMLVLMEFSKKKTSFI
jgi:hypothetical protein